ncbi:MAG: hypothetical protein E2P02_03920 [Acidobacteria bacterium]|nr:MAG: hypothetical protein E2P02_03920 [Acidobacteriota bacterium]
MRSICTASIVQPPGRTASSNPTASRVSASGRLVVELTRVDNEVSVCRVGRDREVTFPHVKVDGLCTNENQRLPVCVQGLENVE